MSYDADAIVVGGGLAGLVAAAELADAGKRVIVVDQEPRQNLGGQAFWSFGGLFLVDSPEQRRLGVKDSFDLALEDWLGTAGFDRKEDHWPRKWAEAYVARLGWVAFDPVNGICATDAHVRVAAGLDHLGAAPLRGTRYGGVGEVLTSKLTVEQAAQQNQN